MVCARNRTYRPRRHESEQEVAMVNALVGFNGMLPAIPAVVGSTAFAMLALALVLGAAALLLLRAGDGGPRPHRGPANAPARRWRSVQHVGGRITGAHRASRPRAQLV